MNHLEKKEARDKEFQNRVKLIKRTLRVKDDHEPGSLIKANKARLEKIKAKSKSK